MFRILLRLQHSPLYFFESQGVFEGAHVVDIVGTRIHCSVLEFKHRFGFAVDILFQDFEHACLQGILVL